VAAEADNFRAGFVAVVGRPNAGKSTLVNALVGSKISIVTPRPQTTRHAVVGVLNRPDAQIIFVDTPGLHSRSRNLLNRAMNRAVQGALAGAEVVMFLVDATGWKKEDDYVLQQVQSSGLPCVLVVNKIDLVRPKAALLPFLVTCSERAEFLAIVPVSASKEDNLARLLDPVIPHLSLSPPLYPLDTTTDRDIGFRVGEAIREQLLLALRQEIPYGLVVEIVALEERPDLVLVDAVIWTARESHTGIIVGKGGANLKQVGTDARLDLQQQFGKQFHIETRVRVKRDWADSERALQLFGFEVRS
jgi:GTPase